MTAHFGFVQKPTLPRGFSERCFYARAGCIIFAKPSALAQPGTPHEIWQIKG